MYLNYFGLNDNPFSIAPNPDYLYMSPRHKEALAHLTFGLRESGGFVMLTGEVGTGKTTVSRKLLQQLPDNTQVAMILNPTLSALELLATVCDELGLAYTPEKASLKYFTDLILSKLAENHQSGMNTVLMVDEALDKQNVYEVIQFIRWINQYEYLLGEKAFLKKLITSYLFIKREDLALKLFNEKRNVLDEIDQNRFNRVFSKVSNVSGE